MTIYLLPCHKGREQSQPSSKLRSASPPSTLLPYPVHDKPGQLARPTPPLVSHARRATAPHPLLAPSAGRAGPRTLPALPSPRQRGRGRRRQPPPPAAAAHLVPAAEARRGSWPGGGARTDPLGGRSRRASWARGRRSRRAAEPPHQPAPLHMTAPSCDGRVRPHRAEGRRRLLPCLRCLRLTCRRSSPRAAAVPTRRR